MSVRQIGAKLFPLYQPFATFEYGWYYLDGTYVLYQPGKSLLGEYGLTTSSVAEWLLRSRREFDPHPTRRQLSLTASAS